VLFFPKLTNYAGGFIVSKRAVIKMGYEKFKHHPVGTGSFVFKSYKPGKKLILTAHGQYFRGCPRLKGVEILFLPDIKDREAGLKSGQLDVIMGTGKKGWIEQIEQEPDIKLDFHGVGEMITIYFNTSIKPMDDVRVRKAIAHALSRETFLNTTNKCLVKKAYSPVPVQFLPGGLTKKEVESLDLAYPKNLQKARQLLMDAGYPDGFTLELVSSEKRLYLSCYNSMRDQLAKIGIKCHINIKAHSEMHRLIRLHPQPLVIYVAWRPNADLFLSRFFHSSAIIVTGAKPDTNFSHYKKIDKIIKDARLSINPEKQINLWKHAQIRILTDMAAYPIMFIKQCYAKRADVDYGHELISTMALYPQFTEKTRIIFNDSSYLNNITTVEKSNSTTKSRNKDD
ncbi:MAG: ABC transporter substrate-binding protein, partial [Thermodesulfobacteriota bacterium]|nr:ABC transporter substrate-binding protein [Thermodesulfobacteriota bacterium]